MEGEIYHRKKQFMVGVNISQREAVYGSKYITNTSNLWKEVNI